MTQTQQAMLLLHRVAFLFVLIHVALAQTGTTNTKPGKLLLNMLIKNEATNLRRTLPIWAKLVDYWLVGVDDANTDDSVDIIKQYLGHLPGEIVTVHFDGMGPTWTQVMKVGINKYPQADFGILADADHVPLLPWDKLMLDGRCSKILYTIWSQDRVAKRQLDWIYRNIPGAMVHRRTHQYVTVPDLPNQAMHSCMSNLELEEREGGYQDRSGKKNDNYIKFLEADLAELGEDARSLFYLAHAHLGIFKGGNTQNPSPAELQHLTKAIDYFTRRTKLEGYVEERFFAGYMLGELKMQYYSDWKSAEEWFQFCHTIDPSHAFPYYMRGKHYRDLGDFAKAFEILEKGAQLQQPQRGLYNQPMYYQCQLKYELAQLLADHPESRKLDNSELQRLLSIIEKAQCQSEPKTDQALQKAVTVIRGILATDRNQESRQRIAVVSGLLESISEFDVPSELLEQWTPLVNKMQTWRDRAKLPTCRQHRRVTTPFLRFVRLNSEELENSLDASEMDSLNEHVQRLRNTCR